MAVINNYQVYCTVEEINLTVWAEEEPSVCPNNNSHSIDQEQTTIIETINEVKTVKLAETHHFDGRISVQSTPRPIGTTTYDTGRGDDPANIKDIGGGPIILIRHPIGGTAESIDDGTHINEMFYIDFNTIDNETYVNSCELQYNNTIYATAICSAVPKVSETEPASNTNYATLPYVSKSKTTADAFIVPAAGTGNINLITPKLVQVSRYRVDDNIVYGPGFWNADYDSVTGTFSNPTPAPTGDGAYNMFSKEVEIVRFVNERFMNAPGRSGNAVVNSKDVQFLSHGIRLRVCLRINKSTDTACELGVNVLMYRKYTI